MRPELTEIEYKEAYLDGKLSSAERLDFERKILQNPEFKEKVEIQKSLVEGIKNKAIRSKIQKAYSQYQLKKVIKSATIIVLIIASIVGGVIYVNTNENKFSDNIINTSEENVYDISASEIDYDAPILNSDSNNYDTTSYKPLIIVPKNKKSITKAGENIPTQLFEIESASDTIITSKNGIDLVFEKSSFVNSDGSQYKGKIIIQLKEALTAKEIINGNLTTITAKGELLETGGMFKLQFLAKNGSALMLKDGEDIIAQIPVEEEKENMLLFDGMHTDEGNLLWTNPKPLENFLIPVDMSLLNFYPENFESTLLSLGLTKDQKYYKDSIYYSFQSHFSEKGRRQFVTSDRDYLSKEAVTSYRYPIKTVGIQPAKIEGFWNKRFNKTLLSTKEFESRIKYIFTECNNKLIDMYVQNIRKEMWEIDELIANNSTGVTQKKFKEFAKLKHGKVEVNYRKSQMLASLYNKRVLDSKRASEKLTDYWRAQIRKDAKFQNLISKNNQREITNYAKNFQTELVDNLNDVNKQLGLKVRVKIRSSGWKNLDRYVRIDNSQNLDNYSSKVLVPTFLSTATRQTATINYKGKTATITYDSISVQIDDLYDEIRVYVVTANLPSYQKMTALSDKLYDYKINALYKYGIAVVGYKNGEMYSNWKADIKAGHTDAHLTPQNEKDFYNQIEQYAGKKVKRSLGYGIEFQKATIKNNARLNKMHDQINFRRELQEIVFPCQQNSITNYIVNNNQEVIKELTED